MTLAEILAELQLNPDFKSLPPEWQTRIANRIATDGLDGAVAEVRAAITAAQGPTLTVQTIPQRAPEYMAEYNRVRALGDRRPWEQWAADHARADPNWLASVQADYAAKNPAPAVPGLEGLTKWATGASPFTTGGDAEDVPLETDLLARTVTEGYADWDRDAARRTEYENALKDLEPAFQGTTKSINNLFDGTTLRNETEASGRLTAGLQAGLNDQLKTQTGALNTELAALQGGLDKQLETRRNALADQLRTRGVNLDAELAARQGALTGQLTARGEAISAQEAARRQALAQAVDELYAAQDPLFAERLKAAQTAATEVNLASQTARDQIAAQYAQDGYVGSSSGTDAALARAAIAGRQGAANLLGQANVRNAGDRAEVGRYAAMEGRGVSDFASDARRGLADFGADETRGLRDYGSGQRRELGDFGADESRSLTDFGAGEQRGLTTYGANERRGLTDYGADETRKISGLDSERTYSLFTNDIARQLENLSLPAKAVTGRLQLSKLGDDYAQTGQNRFMSNLSNFRVNGGPAPQVNPFSTPVNDVMGSAYQNAGAGAFSLAGSIFNTDLSNRRKTTTPSATPSATTKP